MKRTVTRTSCEEVRSRFLLLLTLLALTFTSRIAEAAGDPDLDWWTIETEHFRIHYERNLEPIAERVARLGESIHDRLTGPLGYEPDEKTEIVLTDQTDNANGSASVLPLNVIRLFVTAPADMSPLGDHDDWMLGLLTHEHTHILHVDNKSGLPSVANAILGKTFAPNQVQPRWIIEGLATVLETSYSSGGRGRSSMFDMFLRADFIDDNVAGLDQVSSNAQRWPGSTMFYLYGSRFLAWITEVYGPDVMRAVATDYGAAIIPWGINRAIRRQTGKTYVELYDGFVATMDRRYAAQMKRVERRGLREGKRLTHHGRTVLYPTFAPNHARVGAGNELIYYRADDRERAGLYRLDLTSGDDSMVVRTDHSAPPSFTPEGDVLFANAVNFKLFYDRTDLFTIPKGETATDGRESHRKRLTVGVRANAPSVSPDGRHVVFTRNDKGTTTLMLADRQADGPLKHLRTLLPSRSFDQVYTPTFSPDGRRIAYSAWSAGGFRDVRVLDLDTNDVTSITHDRALDQNPTWSPDGRQLFFSSDRTGIFNVYVHDFDSGTLKQVTNVKNGAFCPTISPDGKLLAYAGYTSRGWDLWLMTLEPSRYLEPVAAERARPDPYDEPPVVKFERRRYSPWPTLRPRNWQWAIAPGDYGSTSFSIGVTALDVVGHHAFAAFITAEPNAPGPELSFDYLYRRLPFDLSVRLSNAWTPRADYRFDDAQITYDEESYAVRSGISYGLPVEFLSQTFALSHTATVIDGELPVATQQPFDPYASITIKPLRGFISIMHLGYSIGAAERTAYAAGPARGFVLNLGLDVADDFTASDESLYAGTYTAQGYLQMPWRGDHTLALRSAGGMATGTFTRSTLFYVGGYNLEGVGVPDLLTSTLFNGAFVLRGYEPSSYRGTNYILNNLEYRIPIAAVERGIQTLPLFLRRIDGNLFVDWGGAWNRFDFEDVGLFEQGAIVNSRQLHTGAGAELWFGIDLGYVVPINIRLGHAIGFSAEAIAGGQTYFLASSAY